MKKILAINQPPKVFDIYRREIRVGDYVAAAALSRKRSYLRVGKVTKITEKGNVSLRYFVDTWSYKDGKRNFVKSVPTHSSLQSADLLIIMSGSVPSPIWEQLEKL